jgi:uncharacterized protein
MKSFLSDKLPELTRILKTHKVKRAYAFGSVCTPAFDNNSDIDLLVKFEDGIEPMEYSDNYFNLLFKLRDFLGREIDLVPESSLKNPYLLQSVNRTKQAIYE